jgi:hypothetical protein
MDEPILYQSEYVEQEKIWSVFFPSLHFEKHF